DHEPVPWPNADAVSVAQRWRAVRVEGDMRPRIVHHRIAPLRARREIVGEPERMADLVRAELADARERGGDRIVGIAGAGQPRPDQRLKDDQVLAGAKRSEQHRALDDL